MKLKLMLTFATFALAAASAASSYRITVNDPMWLGNTQLKPGNYKVEVEGNKVTLKSGKEVVEATAKVEENAQKFDSTALVAEQADGKSKLSEIRVGGSKTKIVFDQSAGGAGGN